jgi:hypothetical protein
MQIREDEWKELIGGYERVLYLCHRNADPDALGSGFALREAFGGDLAAVEGVSRTGAALLEAIGSDRGSSILRSEARRLHRRDRLGDSDQ